jgi:cobalt-zinc-cadmium efflux system outer membrane protein
MLPRRRHRPLRPYPGVRLVPALLLIGLSFSTVVAPAPAVAGSADLVLLDRASVLTLARERSVEMAAARALVDGAEGRLIAARTWRYNPELELEAGPRSRAGEETTWDRSFGLRQRLDLAGRGDRIAAAEAARAAATAESGAAEIAVLAEAAARYLEVLHAERRRRLADDAVALHERLREVAHRRREAGEIGALEDNLAAVAQARARSVAARATATAQAARGALAELLVLERARALEVTGELAWPLPDDLGAVLDAATRHPRLAGLAAREDEAEAGIALARSSARTPEIALSGGVGKEEGADLVRLGIGVGLPVFARGQGQERAAVARHAAVSAEAAAARTLVAERAARAWHRYRGLNEALAAFAADAEAAVADNVRLAEESYRLGKIDLGQVLVVQREHLDALGELADLRLQTALAALDVSAAAGLPPLADGAAAASRANHTGSD